MCPKINSMINNECPGSGTIHTITLKINCSPPDEKASWAIQQNLITEANRIFSYEPGLID